MAITTTTCWRVRQGGNVLNGGGFDPATPNVGVDYTDQDAPQLSLTDLVCTAIGGSYLGAHRYWRLNVTLNNGSPSNLAVGDLEFRATPGGVNQATNGANASASTTLTIYVPANAFDNSTATFWVATASTAQLVYDFGSPVSVAQIRLRSRGDGYPTDAPRNFNIEYSDNNSTWTIGWTVTNQTGWAAGESRIFTDPAYTVGPDSLELTSVTGGFTAAMIGNYIRIASGINFVAGYYRVVAYTNSNTVTLDRTPLAGGSGSSGVGRLGGAFANLHTSFGTGGGYAAATVTSPLAAGHTIYIRGSGSSNPIAADYTANNYFGAASGDFTNGKIRVIGYNGRPRIDSEGLYLWNVNWWAFENLHWKASGSTFGNHGILGAASASINSTYEHRNVWYDCAGFDIQGLHGLLIEDCLVFNTGGTTPGIGYYGISTSQWASVVRGNVVRNWRGSGIFATSMASVQNNVISNCRGRGIYVATDAASYSQSVVRNTIFGCTGAGIEVNGLATIGVAMIEGNIIEGCGNRGLFYSASTTALHDRLAFNRRRKNFFFNNTTANIAGVTSTSDDVVLTGSPFTNAAGGDFSLNNTAGAGAAVKAAAFPGAFPGGVGTSYLDGGAIQSQSGSTLIVVDD